MLAGAFYAEIERGSASYGVDLGKGFELKAYVPPTGKNPTDLLFHDMFDTEVNLYLVNILWTYQMLPSFLLKQGMTGSQDLLIICSTGSCGFVLWCGDPINPAMVAMHTIDSRSTTYDQFQPKFSITTNAGMLLCFLWLWF